MRNHHRRSVLLLLLVACLGCASAPHAAKPIRDASEAPQEGPSERLLEFQRRLIRDGVTGSNVAMVVQSGEVLYHRTCNSGLEGDRDIHADTLFPIWSMSKPITIVAMLLLHERGLFSWEDPVADYLPCFADLQVRDSEGIRPAMEPLRIVHLMTHRSGYTYYGGQEPTAFGVPNPNPIAFRDLQHFVEAAADYPVSFEPGSAYAYGINQAILGRLVEVLSGEHFADFLQQALFEPLGMTDTSFVLDEERRERFQPLYIRSGALRGFTDLLDELSYAPGSRAHFGGEGLVSNMADYGRFCEMLVGGGVFRGKRMLSESSLATMTKAWTEDFDEQGAPGYDLGFSVYVLNEAGRDGTLAPEGIYGWSGYHNTHFWIDPAGELFGLFMTRAREYSNDIPRAMRAALYGVVE